MSLQPDHSLEDAERQPVAPQPVSVRLAIPTSPVRWTYVLLGINVVVWVAMTLLGGSTDTAVLVFFGAKVNSLIQAGQYWRLVTAAFLHIGLTHLAFNCYALFNLGPFVEARLGATRFLTLYLLSGVLGNALSYVGNDALAAGASGAIFGLIGAMIAYFVLHRDKFGQQGRRQLLHLLTIAGINLFLGLSPGIDNLAHIGGLVGGLGLGFAMMPRYEIERGTFDTPPRLVAVYRNTYAMAGVVAVCATVLALVWLGW